MILFSLLAVIMFVSKIVMEALPNIHLLGTLTITYTLVYRHKALIPIYIYVLLNGLYAGFTMWWIPYLYIWTILWALTMLIPQRLPKTIKAVIYPLLCALHGLAFGALYAPAQAIMFGLNFQQMIAWILAGLPFDLLHCGGNLLVGTLILPISELLNKLLKKHRVI